MTDAPTSKQLPGFEGKTPDWWNNRFNHERTELKHLLALHKPFEAMMYVMMNIFPTVERFTSWRMGNEAVAMKAISDALQQLNKIKAIFNECGQNHDFWKHGVNGGGSVGTLFDEIHLLLFSLHFNPALKGIASSIVEQLKVITHASSNPGMWVNSGTAKDPYWLISRDYKPTWNDGTKTITGSISSYIEWMWTQEWEGKNPISQGQEVKPTFEVRYMPNLNQYLFWIYDHGNPITGQMTSVEFAMLMARTIDNTTNPTPLVAGAKSPIFIPVTNNGKTTWNVKYYTSDGKWETTSQSDYVAMINTKIANAENSAQSHPEQPIDFQLMAEPPPPKEPKTPMDPKFTTGPTTQAFAAISTTLNSQSSVAQSKFKYLQSNEQEFLGIEHSSMSQFVKVEETMTRQMGAQ